MNTLYTGGVSFDTTISTAGIIINVVGGIILIVFVLRLLKTKNKLQELFSFFMTFVGVSAFELITGSLRKIQYLGKRAFSFYDISWLLALIRTGVLYFSDIYLSKKQYGFLKTLAFASIVTGIITFFLLNTGILSFMPEAQSAVRLWLGSFPLNSLIYIPVRLFLCLSIKKYFDLSINNNTKYSPPKITRKNIGITLCCVLAIEYILEPTIIIKNLPSRTFLFNDINLIFTLIHVLVLIRISRVLMLIQLPSLLSRLGFALFLASLVGFVLVNYAMKQGILEFSTSALENYTTNSWAFESGGITSMIAISLLFFYFVLIPTVKYHTLSSKN